MLSSSTPQAPTLAPAYPAKARIAPPRAGLEITAKVVAQLRDARAGLENFSAAYPVLTSAIRGLSRLEIKLQRPLRVAIVGEFNSGKSSLANLLVGIDSLPTAIVSNTRIPTLLYYAATPEIFAVAADGARRVIDAEHPINAAQAVRLDVGLPSERLKTMQFIDLPGLADPRFDDTAVDLAPHGIDAVLWCTVATQAWKESERLAWSAMTPRMRDHGILVVTHRDLLRDSTDQEKLLARLRDAAGAEFREIVMLSTAAGAEPALIALPPDEHEAAREASACLLLEQAIDRQLDALRQSRGTRAIEAINRIASRALSRIEPARTELVRTLVAAG